MVIDSKMTVWLCAVIVISCTNNNGQPSADSHKSPKSTSPASGPTETSAGSGSVVAPVNIQAQQSDPPHQTACNYFAGKAIGGQAINLDLCSIQPGNLSSVPFFYYLGSERVESTANCLNLQWTTYPENQVHTPQSKATEKMLKRVCQG